MDIKNILAKVATLSKEEKARLAKAYEEGTLTDEEKALLREHLKIAIVATEQEAQVGQELFGRQG